MDGQAVFDGAALARTAGQKRIFFDVWRGAEWLETGVFGEQRGEPFRAFDHVGLQEDLPARPHCSKKLFEDGRTHHQSLRVSLLPPGIGEVNEHGLETRIGKARDGRPRIFGKHARARREALLRQATVDQGRPLEANLEAHDANAGVGLQSFEDEAAATRSNLELDGAARTLHERARVERFSFGQARGVGIRMVLHGQG